jgi:hypothetical protein
MSKAKTGGALFGALIGGSGRHAPRARPEEGAAPKKFAVLNAVLIFILERWLLAKSLIFLARPERFELPTPRFVVRRSMRRSGVGHLSAGRHSA